MSELCNALNKILEIPGEEKVWKSLKNSKRYDSIEIWKNASREILNSGFHCDLGFDFELYFQDYFKVNFVFNGNPYFGHGKSKEREISRTNMYPGDPGKSIRGLGKQGQSYPGK